MNRCFADIVGVGIICGMKEWMEHFQEAAKGLAVAHVWHGYGSALFIEFGELTPRGTRKNGSARPPSG